MEEKIMSGSDERGLGKDRVEVSGFSTKALDHAFSELRGGENVVDFDEKEFSLELISHMNDRMGEPFNFPYSKLLNSQPRFNIKKFKGMNTEEYLKICSQYIVTYRDKRGELCIRPRTVYDESVFDEPQSEGVASPRERDEEGLLTRWIIGPIARVVSKRIRELSRDNKRMSKDIESLNSKVSSLEGRLEKETERKEYWKENYSKERKGRREGVEGYYRNLIDDLERENSELSKEVQRLKTEAGGTIDEGDDEEKLSSVIEVLELARAEMSNLLFWDSAFKSAKQSPYKQPEKVLAVFRKMDSVAGQWLAREDGTGSYIDELREDPDEPTIMVAENESSTSLGKHDRVFSTTIGRMKREAQMVAHVKLGMGPHKGGAGTRLRIHFLPDRGAGKILIGYCGEHLPT
mgnify:FL=1